MLKKTTGVSKYILPIYPLSSSSSSLHTYISSLWNTLKRKPLFFKFSWNFGVTMTLLFSLMYPPPQKSWILSELQLFQSFPTKVAQNDSEWPISLVLQLFQSFPTEVAQNDSEWPIFPDLQLFQSFPTKVAHNHSEWAILLALQLFQSFPTEWLRMTRSDQFCSIFNFSNFVIQF